MGSIGYIGGTIPYEYNASAYPYENNSNHYQLWKPPSGYFPRGEAPPPYEEAVAMNASSCTVSVATTTHRTVPISICPGDSSSDIAPSNITTNTTNLINININNAGSITAVATGENHQINNSISAIQNNSTSNTLMVSGANQPRSTQTQFNCTSAACLVENGGIAAANVTNTSSAICSYASPSQEPKNQQQQQQCEEAQAVGQICMRSPCNGRAMGALKAPTETPTVQEKPVVVSAEVEAAAAELKAPTILPPPLFDGSKSLTRDHTGGGGGSKTPSTYRRYHRTIPRHFTTGSSSTGEGAKVDKKTCQCPIQHVPMTYMGASHLNSVPQSVFLSGLPTKLISSKNKSKAKADDGTQHHSSSTSGSLQVTEGGAAMGGISQTNSLRRGRSPNAKIDGASSIITTPSSGTNSLPSSSSSATAKIPTISKYVINAEMNKPLAEVELHHTTNSLPQTPNQSHPRHVQSILKHSPHAGGGKVSGGVLTKEVDTPPFPIQLIDTMSSALHHQQQQPQNPQNPALPPKLNRTGQRYHVVNAAAPPKIQTISKAGTAHYVPRMIPYTGTASSHFYKSLPRNEEALKTMQAFVFADTRMSEKSQSLHKINAQASPGAATSIIYGFPPAVNHITYSLPKTSMASAGACGKNGARCSISEVVSKVPSVINIPSPTANPITVSAGHAAQRQQIAMHRNAAAAAGMQKPSTTGGGGDEKPLPVCTTSKNCSNPKEHFLPNDTSLDDDYLSECENCKSAHGSRYYLDAETEETPQETMTLQRKMPDNEEDQPYYRASLTLPTNTKQKSTSLKNSRETWFTSIPGSSSSDDEACE
ncbi:uncharacterized protein LOC129786563 [Lutzomyia longipalpis]|uniref:uncharacterized protein LOC129786563 n=1 Tax=Lutzomyia longipalpis TaxID=7200 RepID=UPI0024835AB4|nr:uncharacterized protein LOC129786563 [Lutzomyia longipalpis]